MPQFHHKSTASLLHSHSTLHCWGCRAATNGLQPLLWILCFQCCCSRCDGRCLGWRMARLPSYSADAYMVQPCRVSRQLLQGACAVVVCRYHASIRTHDTGHKVDTISTVDLV